MEIVWRPTQEVLEQANVVRLMRRLGFDTTRELAAPLGRGPGMVLARGDRRHGTGVLAAVGRTSWISRAGRSGRPGSSAEAEPRLELRAPLGRADAGRVAAATLGVGGRRAPRRSPTRSSRDARDALRGGARRRSASSRATASPIFLPMSPEVSIVSHACAHRRRGAGADLLRLRCARAVAQRLQDSEAKVVGHRRRLAAARPGGADEGDRRRGGSGVAVGRARRRLAAARSRATFRCSRVATSSTPTRCEAAGHAEPLEVDSEHPYLLTYTSGTTGKPKGVLHVQGGFLVSRSRARSPTRRTRRPGDVIHFVTDMGWIMGPVEGGRAGARSAARSLFAEGAPDWPAADRLVVADRARSVSPILGCSPTLMRALIPHRPRAGRAPRPVARCGCSSRRASRGIREPYRWLPRATSAAAAARSSTARGGTRGRRAASCRRRSAAPIKACSLGGPALGMAMDVVDAEGRRRSRGEVGELVCRKPFPAMTRGFWRDPSATSTRTGGGSRVSGCTATGRSVDEDGYWFLHGRSGRHAQHRRQSGSGRRSSSRPSVAHPAVAGGRGGRGPARGQGRDGLDLLRALVPG